MLHLCNIIESEMDFITHAYTIEIISMVGNSYKSLKKYESRIFFFLIFHFNLVCISRIDLLVLNIGKN